MRRVVRERGRWHVKGPMGGTVMEYDCYLMASYHAITGERAPDTATARKRIKAMTKRLV